MKWHEHSYTPFHYSENHKHKNVPGSYPDKVMCIQKNLNECFVTKYFSTEKQSR